MAAKSPNVTLSEQRPFSPPAESDWHRMISEAAYFLAEKRAFAPGRAMQDWLDAERAIKELLSGPGMTGAT